jgi:phosphoenolpyruvate-protein kinase (PTS system EI component)
MYWVVPVAIVGFSIATAILNTLNQSAANEREEWEKDRERTLAQIKEAVAKLDIELNRLQKQYDFDQLRNVYIFSFKTADKTYRLMERCEHCIQALKDAQKNTVSSLQELYSQRKQYDENESQKELEERIIACRSLLKMFKEDLQCLTIQKREMLEEVKRLNEKTVIFKEHIRDNFGPYGRQWYERIEQRKKLKRFLD